MAEPVPPDFDIPLPVAIPSTSGGTRGSTVPPISVKETQKAIELRTPPSPTPEDTQKAVAQVAAIEGRPRTPAGELTPSLEFFNWALPEATPEALRPQVKLTAEEAAARDTAVAAEIARVEALKVSKKAKEEEAARTGTTPDLTPDEIQVGVAGGGETEAFNSAIQWLTETKNRSGGISETPIGYGFRLLFSPVNAAIGTAEGLITQKPVTETISERVKGGMGFTGAAIDVARSPAITALADKYGIDRSYAESAGMLIGLGADLLMPIDLGIGTGIGKVADKIGKVTGTGAEMREAGLLARATEAAKSEENIAAATEHFDILESIEPMVAREVTTSKPKDILAQTWEAKAADTVADASITHDALVMVEPKYKEYIDRIRSAALSEDPFVDIAEAKNVMKSMLDEELQSMASTPDVLSQRYVALKDALTKSGVAAERTGFQNALSLPQELDLKSQIIAAVVDRNLKKAITRDFVAIAENSLVPKTAKKAFADGAKRYLDTIIPEAEIKALKGTPAGPTAALITITPERARRILEPLAYDLPDLTVASQVEVLKGRIPSSLHTRLQDIVDLATKGGDSIMIAPSEWNNIQVAIINRLAEVVPARISKIKAADVTPFYYTDKAIMAIGSGAKWSIDKALGRFFTLKPKLSPAAMELETSVRSKFSSLMDDFKYKIRTERARLKIRTERAKLESKALDEGIDEAFARVVFDEWKPRDNPSLTQEQATARANDWIGEESATLFFDDWMRTIYGGYEDVVSVIKHDSGQTSTGISPQKLRDAILGLGKDSSSRDAVLRIGKESKSRYEVLRDEFINKATSASVTRADVLSFLTQVITQLSKEKVSFGELIGKKIEGTIDPVIVFDPKNVTETVAITYLNKRASAIFNGEVKAWASKYNIIPEAGTNWRIGKEIEQRLILKMEQILTRRPNPIIDTSAEATQLVTQTSLAQLPPVIGDIKAEAARLVTEASLLDDVIPNIAAQNVAEFVANETTVVSMNSQIVTDLLDKLNALLPKGSTKFTEYDAISLLNAAKATPALVEWTLPIRSMFKENLTLDDLKSLAKAFSISFKDESAVSTIQSISSAFKDSAEFKKALMDATELDKFSSQIEHLKVKDMPPRFTDFAGGVLSDMARRTSNIARAGVLSGYVLPNLGYLLNNVITAPLIIMQTLGGKEALSAMLSGKAGAVLAELYKPLGAGVKADKVLFTTVDGRVYLTSDVAAIVASSNINKSMGSFEVTAQVINDILAWSGRTSGGKKRNVIMGFIDRNMTTSERQNIWGEIAAASDTYFRTKVLTKALMDGKSEAEAVQLARTSLFDYGALQPWERASFAKLFWFYSFMRHSLVSSAEALIKNPSRAAHLYKISEGFPDDGRYHEDTVDYAESKPFLRLIKSNKGTYAQYGPKVPFVDSTVQLIDYLSLVAPVVYGDPTIDTDKKVKDLWNGVLIRMGSNMNPAYTTIPAAATGVNIGFGEVRKTGNYIDPKFLYWLSLSPTAWDTFTTYVPLEPKPFNEVKPTDPTFNGVVWKIATPAGEMNWFLIQQAMLAGGIQRALRDYSSYDPAGLTEEQKAQSASILEDVKAGVIEAGTRAEVITGVKEQNPEAIRRQAIRSDLKEE